MTDWQRVHPLSPLLRTWAVLVGVVAVLATQVTDQMSWITGYLSDNGSPVTVLLIVAGVLVGVPVAAVICWVISLPWWRATGYRVDDEEIAVRRGVVSRQVRTARFDRVQAVDVVELLLPRIFRLAAVKVETAGGSGSAVRVEYLPRDDAERLRARLLQLVHGEKTAETAEAGEPGEPEAGPAEPSGCTGTVIVPTIPVSRSLVAAVLSGSTVLTLAAVIVAVSTPVGVAVLVPVLLGSVPWLWRVLNASWRYTARLTDGVLGISFGLTERRRQSVPLTRIHAVEVSQPLMWRLLGWWRVRVDIAGYGAPGDTGGSTTSVLPVGDLALARHVLTVLAPVTPQDAATVANPEGRGASDGEDSADSAGTAAVRRRYTSPTVARWMSPVDRTRQGVTLLGEADGTPTDGALRAVVTHRGRLRRVVSVIRPAHIQELSFRRGAVQKLLGLAGVRFDLVPGPVSMAGRDLTEADADDLLNRLRARTLPAPSPGLSRPVS